MREAVPRMMMDPSDLRKVPRAVWLLVMRCRRRPHSDEATQVEDVQVLPLLGPEAPVEPAVLVLREDDGPDSEGLDCPVGRYRLVYVGNRAWKVVADD
jgi:hypothetical protein